MYTTQQMKVQGKQQCKFQISNTQTNSAPTTAAHNIQSIKPSNNNNNNNNNKFAQPQIDHTFYRFYFLNFERKLRKQTINKISTLEWKIIS
jgi:hypothetical protein